METGSLLNAALSLIFVLSLIGLAAVALRYVNTDRFLKKVSGKGKEKRLQLVDFLTIDARRKLLLVKRDNVEHLILIGAERETIVESNIKTSASKK